MNVPDSMLASYPHIFKYLGPWLQQLSNMGGSEEYKIILNELEGVRSGTAQEEREPNLERLDHHLDVASRVCGNFQSLFSEKRGLGNNVEKANEAIFDKLAEIRAIVGLHRLGFKNIKFAKTPDLLATLKGMGFLIEVTRLGASLGKRSKVWDLGIGSVESGIPMGMQVSGGKSVGTLSGAIYSKIEDKYPQLKKSIHKADGMIVWISLGRDYLTAGRYELPDVGLQLRMSNAKKALDLAFQQIRNTGLYSSISYVVLSRGRDNDDLISPESNIDG